MPHSVHAWLPEHKSELAEDKPHVWPRKTTWCGIVELGAPLNSFSAFTVDPLHWISERNSRVSQLGTAPHHAQFAFVAYGWRPWTHYDVTGWQRKNTPLCQDGGNWSMMCAHCKSCATNLPLHPMSCCLPMADSIHVFAAHMCTPRVWFMASWPRMEHWATPVLLANETQCVVCRAKACAKCARGATTKYTTEFSCYHKERVCISILCSHVAIRHEFEVPDWKLLDVSQVSYFRGALWEKSVVPVLHPDWRPLSPTHIQQ